MSTPNPATTDWVPVFAGADINYRGDFSGVQYKDGDIVIYQGSPWMCVRPTTSPPDQSFPGAAATALPPRLGIGGMVPTSMEAATENGYYYVTSSTPGTKPVGMSFGLMHVISEEGLNYLTQMVYQESNNAAWIRRRYGSGTWRPWVAMAPPSLYDVTLPTAQLYDGMECTLVDILATPTYQWRFRYNAGSTNADKWEFIGGAPARAETVGPDNVTATGPAVDIPNGPSLTVPRAGVWEYSFGADGYNSLAGINFVLCVRRGAITGGLNDGVSGRTATAGADSLSLSRSVRSTLGAGDVLWMQAYANGGTASFRSRWLSLLPVRVS